MTSLLFRLPALFAIFFSILSDASELPDLKGRTILAVTENAYIPLSFSDPTTGKGIGLEYDAMNEIAKRLNANIQWRLNSWDSMLEAVQHQQYDIGMNGIAINEQRTQQVDFSTPYMTSQLFMLARVFEDRFHDARSFIVNEDLSMGAQLNTTNFCAVAEKVFHGDKESPRIKSFKTFSTAVHALKIGDVDSVLMDAQSVRGYIGKHPGEFKIIGGPLGGEEFGFIFPHGSDLVTPVNAAINSMKADGTLKALNKKWLFDYWY